MVQNFDVMHAPEMNELSKILKEVKQEILDNQNETPSEREDEILLEVIDVLQEEMALKKKKKENNLKNDVRFLAYLNFFTTIIDGDLEEEDFDDEECEWEFAEED